MKTLVDTNVLVYRFDPRWPAKREVATSLLRERVEGEDLFLAHQTLVEFVAAATKVRSDLGGAPILERAVALREAENLLLQLPLLYPDEAVLRTAIRGTLTYQLSWFDAHLWAYAEVHGIDEILSEDFEHGRCYGSVRVRDPFLEAADEVHELPARYESRSTVPSPR